MDLSELTNIVTEAPFVSVFLYLVIFYFFFSALCLSVYLFCLSSFHFDVCTAHSYKLSSSSILLPCSAAMAAAEPLPAFKELLVAVQDGVGTITFNRPARKNAINTVMVPSHFNSHHLCLCRLMYVVCCVLCVVCCVVR
jgi:hypothetical protein